MAALDNNPRLATVLVGVKNNTEAATTARLAVALEEPPRGGNTDLTVVFSQNQPAW